MSKINQLKDKYVADVECMATKSRFGYFSILPSHTAARGELNTNNNHRDSDGKVKTEPRNIYPGLGLSSSAAKKGYFSYVPSPFHGSPYEDPGRHERQSQMKQNKRKEGQQIFKPASLSKTIVHASYQYVNQNDPKRSIKNYRDQNGKVKTENANILTSSLSKIQFNKIKHFKYVQCPPAQKKLKKIQQDTDKEKREPFKLGHECKQTFSNNIQTYFIQPRAVSSVKQKKQVETTHQSAFRPSCTTNLDIFNPIVYKQQGNGKQQVKKINKNNQKSTQPFKLIKRQHNSKPCPSISLSKMNLLRCIR